MVGYSFRLRRISFLQWQTAWFCREMGQHRRRGAAFLAQRISIPVKLPLVVSLACVLSCGMLQAQSITLAGARGVDSGVNSSAAGFAAVQMDSAKDLYLLEDEGDGVRVLKLSAAGTTLLASAHLGAGGDHGTALALDGSGNVYVAGIAGSGQLTASSGAAENFPSAQSGFVAGLSAGLSETFLTSTGGNLSAATGLFVQGGTVYVTGTIQTNTLPVTGNAVVFSFPAACTTTGFVEAFNATGTSLSFASYLGGANGNTLPAAIAADAGGNMFVAGSDTATGFPTVNALQPELVGTSDMFLTKLSAGAGIEWSTLLGSAGGTVAATSVALAANGSVYAGVNATTLALPVTNSLMPLPTARSWGMVMNFAGDGSKVDLSTVLGDGNVHAIALDSAGDIVATGAIQDLAAWPLTKDLQGVGTAFVTAITSSGNLLYSTRIGGIAEYAASSQQSQTSGNGIAIASDGALAVAGTWTALSATSGWLSSALDLPMVNAPNAALPGTLTSATSSSACQNASAACSVGYVATLATTVSSSPRIAVSVDTLPNLSVRNVGTQAFTVTAVSASGYSTATDCLAAGSMVAGAACNVVLTGNGPGNITVQTSDGVATFALASPALSAAQNVVALQPKEAVFAGFGGASATTPTIVASNVTTASQIISPNGNPLGNFNLYDGTCTGPDPDSPSDVLPAGSACTLLAMFSDNSTEPSQDGAVQGYVAVQISGEPTNVESFYGYQLDEDHPGEGQSGLTISTASIDFGTNYLGGPQQSRTVIVANAMSSAVTPAFVGTPASDPNFIVEDFCPVTLPAYSSCAISVTYASAFTSVDSATLTLPSGATLQLSGVMLQPPGEGGLSVNPAITVTPASLVFGAVGVGSTTTTQAVTISNSGGSTVAIALTVSSGFTQTNNCGGSVAANGSCVVQVQFSPTALGVAYGQLTVTPSASSPVAVALRGGGTDTINFGAIELGSGATQWISLGSFEGNVTATVQGPYETVVVNGYSYTSPPAIQFTANSTASCTFNCYVGIRAVAGSAGTQSGTLNIAEQGGATTSYPLTAVALSQTGPLLSAYALTFATTPLNSASAQQMVSVVNPTTGAMTISSVAASSGFTVANGCGASLAAGASCSVGVAFAPTAIGAITGTLTIATDAGTVTAQLSGNAASSADFSGHAEAAPGLTVSPATLEFPAQSLLQASAPEMLTITNNSSATQAVSVTAPAQFSVDNTQCLGLAAQASCMVPVRFIPFSAGNVTGTIQIQGAASETNIAARGSGVSVTRVGSPAYPPLTQPISLSANPQGDGSTELMNVTNAGAQPLTISGIAASGVISGNTCTSPLAAGASCSVTVVTLIDTGCGAQCGSSTENAALTLLTNADSSPDTYTITQTYSGEQGATGVPGYQASAASLTFPQTAMGNTAAQSFQVMSTGSAALTLAFTAAGDFQESDNCGGTLAAYQGGSYPFCTVTVTFAPAASGFRTGTLQVATSAGFETITLAGNGPAASGPVSTTTTLSASANTVPQGQSVTLTSRVLPSSENGTPTGTISFIYSGSVIAKATLQSGAASYTASTSGLAPGSYTLTAKYSGDANDNSSTSSPLTVTITAGLHATKTTLTANPQVVAPNGSVTLTAGVSRTSASGNPGGTVQFYSGSSLLGSATLANGTAALSLSTSAYAPGSYSVVANYVGDSTDAASSSSPVTITIRAGVAATTTTLTATPSSVTQGASVVLRATVAETAGSAIPAGTVTFHYGSLVLGAQMLTNGVAQITASTSSVPPATYGITASYGGNSTDSASVSSAVAVVVKAPTKVTLTAMPQTVTAGQQVTLTATVAETSGSGTPGGSVSFTVAGTQIGAATVLSGVAAYSASTSGLPPGTYSVVANYPGDNGDGASVSVPVNVMVQ